jgi:hypothetical protein
MCDQRIVILPSSRPIKRPFRDEGLSWIKRVVDCAGDSIMAGDER